MSTRPSLRGRGSVALAALAIVALSLLAAGAANADAANMPTGFRSKTIFENLNEPTTFKFAPDGRTFVALKGGKIVVFPNGAKPNATPVEFANLAKETYDYGDKGILGLALDPKFDEGRPYVYVLLSYDHEIGAGNPTPKYGTGPTYEGDPCPTPTNGCVMSGRLLRLTAEEGTDHAKPSAAAPEKKLLIAEDWCQQFSSHSIGDLAFGPEGALFASGGDGASFENPDWGQFGNPCKDPPGGSKLEPPSAEGGSLRSQSPLRTGGQTTLDGTVIRIDPETGEGWPGNPYYAESGASADKKRIIAFGFRNPFRFFVDPKNNVAYVDNVGNGGWEEIDRVPIGAATAYNSGWPCYEGPEQNYQFKEADLSVCEGLYASGTAKSPLYAYSHFGHAANVGPDPCPSYNEPGYNGSAISGNAIYEGSDYPPEYNHALFFADAVRGCMYVMLANAFGEPDPKNVQTFYSNGVPYAGTDIERGPEGKLFWSSVGAGNIDRIDYGIAVPNATLTADKRWGQTPLTVNFNAGGSTGEGELNYAWDLDGDGEFDDGTGPTQTKTYAANSNVEVSVRVTSENGKSAVAEQTIYPGDEPPTVTISKPSPSLTWSVGQPIEFAGSATAFGGAKIPASSLNWVTRVLHCPSSGCHEHPLQTFSGVESGSLAAPNHEYPSAINFFLTATDSRGLSNQATVKIAARPVALQIRSVPAGVPIALTTDQKGTPTPFETLIVEGSPTTLTAPTTATIGGVTYTFERWSDGGARVHTVEGQPGTYTAIYSSPAGPPPPGGKGGGSTPKAPGLRSHPAKVTTSTTAKFAFSGSAGERFQCKLDGKKFASCRSPRTYRHLKTGRHSFRVYGVEASGARGAVTAFKWKVVKKKR